MPALIINKNAPPIIWPIVNPKEYGVIKAARISEKLTSNPSGMLSWIS